MGRTVRFTASNALPFQLSFVCGIMVTIEIDSDKGGPSSKLCVNGTMVQRSYAYRGYPEKRIEATLYDPQEALAITKYSIADLIPAFNRITIWLDNVWPELRSRAEVKIASESREVTILLAFLSDAERWAGPFSFAEFRDAVGVAVSEAQIAGLRFWADSSPTRSLRLPNAFAVSVSIADASRLLQDEIDEWIAMLRPLLEHTRAVLSERVQRDTLVTLFNFPPPFRTACEQYLLYFIQFLKDLGIAAEGDIRHRAGQVLFSVKPDEGIDALDRIQEALSVYLQIPGTPELDAAFADARDIAALQLHANVHHLRSQLTLASAVLRARDAEVEALKISNYQYRQMIAAPAELNHIASLPSSVLEKASDEEPLLDGIVTLTEYEGKGFKVNLPAILRKLKRQLGSIKDQV